MEEIRNLAYDIDIFSYDYDPYEYNDNVDDREQHVDNICTWICNHDEGLLKWLKDIIENNPGSKDAAEAASLIERIGTVYKTKNEGGSFL